MEPPAKRRRVEVPPPPRHPDEDDPASVAAFCEFVARVMDSTRPIPYRVVLTNIFSFLLPPVIPNTEISYYAGPNGTGPWLCPLYSPSCPPPAPIVRPSLLRELWGYFKHDRTRTPMWLWRNINIYCIGNHTGADTVCVPFPVWRVEYIHFQYISTPQWDAFPWSRCTRLRSVGVTSWSFKRPAADCASSLALHLLPAHVRYVTVPYMCDHQGAVPVNEFRLFMKRRGWKRMLLITVGGCIKVARFANRRQIIFCVGGDGDYYHPIFPLLHICQVAGWALVVNIRGESVISLQDLDLLYGMGVDHVRFVDAPLVY